MRTLILFSLLLLPLFASAQEPVTGTIAHELFGGKYTVALPDYFEATECNIYRIPYVDVQEACFKLPEIDNGINFTLTQVDDAGYVEEFFQNHLKQFNDGYHEIVKQEFIDNEQEQYCIIIVKLKDEYYTPGEWFELGDGSVSPYWQAHLLKLENGELFAMDAFYNHDQDRVNNYADYISYIKAQIK